MKYEYKDDIAIDKYDLDNEWLKLSDLYDKYNEEWARAVTERDSTKSNLELIKAEIDKEIRDLANKEGKKVTESAISNAIVRDFRYKTLNAKLIKGNEEVNILSGVKDIFGSLHKKQLDRLTDLFLAGYYTKDFVSKKDYKRS